MMPWSPLRMLPILAGGLLLSGLGCFRGSPSVVFHTLRAFEASPVPGGPLQGLAVEVLPVSLPELLRRPQLVTALGPDSVELSPGHAWGNVLEQDMQRVLVANLAQLLGSGRVVAFPQGPRVGAAFRVEVEVLRCEGRPGGNLKFEATWMITGAKAEQALVLRRTVLDLPVRGQDASALVAAHSEALASLSREVAAALKGL